jgi:hypothetical protein
MNKEKSTKLSNETLESLNEIRIALKGTILERLSKKPTPDRVFPLDDINTSIYIYLDLCHEIDGNKKRK